MSSQRELECGDLVVCCDGGGVPLLNEGVWLIRGLHPLADYPVELLQMSPRPAKGVMELRHTNVYRVTLLEEVLPDLRLVYAEDLTNV